MLKIKEVNLKVIGYLS